MVEKAKSVNALLKREYSSVRAISFDYAVMERISDILVAESSFKWDDVGTWTSVANHFPADKRNNICIGRTLLHDVADSIVVGDGNHHVMALVGVKDLIVVNNGNITLICNRNRAQDIKKIVQRLTYDS